MQPITKKLPFNRQVLASFGEKMAPTLALFKVKNSHAVAEHFKQIITGVDLVEALMLFLANSPIFQQFKRVVNGQAHSKMYVAYEFFRNADGTEINAVSLTCKITNRELDLFDEPLVEFFIDASCFYVSFEESLRLTTLAEESIYVPGALAEDFYYFTRYDETGKVLNLFADFYRRCLRVFDPGKDAQSWAMQRKALAEIDVIVNPHKGYMTPGLVENLPNFFDMMQAVFGNNNDDFTAAFKKLQGQVDPCTICVGAFLEQVGIDLELLSCVHFHAVGHKIVGLELHVPVLNHKDEVVCTLIFGVQDAEGMAYFVTDDDGFVCDLGADDGIGPMTEMEFDAYLLEKIGLCPSSRSVFVVALRAFANHVQHHNARAFSHCNRAIRFVCVVS